MTLNTQVVSLINTSVDDCRITLDCLLNFTEHPEYVLELCRLTLAHLDARGLEHKARRQQIKIVQRMAERRLEAAARPAAEMHQMVCDICGHANPPGAKICTKCYAPLDC